jgi:uncharacterized membrane protein YdbT with pleckstrin-like domain
VHISADLLDDDEDVLVDQRPHWIFFLGPLFLTAAAIAVVVVVVRRFPDAPVTVAWVLGALVGIPAIWLLARMTRWFGTSITVTDRRIVLRAGVLRRQLVNLRLQRVVDTHCSQRLVELLIGSGRVVLEVEGEEGGLALDDVRRPKTVQRVISRQLSQLDLAWRGRPSTPARTWRDDRPPERHDRTPPAGVPRVSEGLSGTAVADQLFALDRLRREGILSEHEFASKKAELLRRM